MTRKHLFLALIVTISFNIASAQSWTNLFDGRTLDSWIQRGGSANYRVENGAIVGYSKVKTLNSFLCTKDAYDDFILEFEFLVDNDLNSLLSTKKRQAFFEMIEI